MERDMEAVRSVGAGVYVDRDRFVELVAKAIRQTGGEMRGKAGLLGENKERKEARHLAGALGAHVGYAASDWKRRYEQAIDTERWKREKQDVIEVPGLSPGSEAILKQLDRRETSEKAAFLEKRVETPEGRRALEEAKAITDAMKRRFGTSDVRNLDLVNLARGQVEKVDAARVAAAIRVAHRAKTVELFRQQDLVWRKSKELGLTI